MIEDIYKIQFKGAAFTQETILPFFDKESERISIIYGRNGSGKSTVSKAILKAAGEDVDGIETAVFLSSDDSLVNLANTNEKSVYVFNEQYIVDNVRIKEAGLDTIVMFGEQINLDEQILKAEDEKIKLLKRQTDLYLEYDKYNNSSSVLAPRYYMDKIFQTLSGDNNWAGRIRAIKGLRRNASVSEDIVNRLMENEVKESLETIRLQYEDSYSQLGKVMIAEGKIMTPIRVVDENYVNESKIITLLSERIEKPELTEREVYLFSLLGSNGANKLEDIKNVFSNKDTSICPFCFQSISAEYRVDFLGSISKVLSNIVEEHKINLRDTKVQEIYVDLEPFKIIDNDFYERCKKQIEVVNINIRTVNKLIDEKINNPYKTIDILNLEITAELKVLNHLITELDEKRKLYNEQFDNVSLLKSNLLELNNKLAYHEIIDDYRLYIIYKNKQKAIDDNIEENKKQLRKVNGLINHLQAQKQSVNIAVEIINNSLRYIFFSKERLEIKVENNTYKLKSNGMAVKPSEVSTGERNILALCYFFTDILRQKEEINAYSDEVFVIIDDPVSSFDYENRVGIISLLKERLSSIICGNTNTKVVLFSHDIQSIFDFEKMCSEIDKKANKCGLISCKHRVLELNEKMICDFRYKKRTEYTEFIKEIYNFAVNGDEKYELSIGNIMRRALECFATFCFKMGIDEISCNADILALLGDDDLKKYFENLMYRLVLNGESHMEERIRGIYDQSFCQMYTKKEKQKTAREILVFLYLLNQLHVKVHLEGISNAINNIEQWKETIKNGEGNLTNEDSLKI